MKKMLHLGTSSLLVLCPICTFLSQSCTNAIPWKCKSSYQKVGVYLFARHEERFYQDLIPFMCLRQFKTNKVIGILINFGRSNCRIFSRWPCSRMKVWKRTRVYKLYIIRFVALKQKLRDRRKCCGIMNLKYFIYR